MTMNGTTRTIGRKTLARLAAATLALCGAGIASAQVPVVNAAYVALAPQDLQGAVAPVALYPDALLAQTLVASTHPQDVESAAQWLRAGGNPAQADFNPWDDSVKGLVHDPAGLYLLADNYSWMNDLGNAFLNRRADTMAAVQLVRSRAYANGELTSNAYQTVIIDDQMIQIIPANPQVIYQPVYEPQAILGDSVVVQPASVIRFGVGIEVGAWLRNDCDWHDHDVYVGDWGSHRPWWEHHEFDHGRQVNVYVNNRPGRFEGARRITEVRNVTHVNNVERVTNVNVVRTVAPQHEAQRPTFQRQAHAEPAARMSSTHGIQTVRQATPPSTARRGKVEAPARQPIRVERDVPQQYRPAAAHEQRASVPLRGASVAQSNRTEGSSGQPANHDASARTNSRGGR